jgi:hypothetical protein
VITSEASLIEIPASKWFSLSNFSHHTMGN